MMSLLGMLLRVDYSPPGPLWSFYRLLSRWPSWPKDSLVAANCNVCQSPYSSSSSSSITLHPSSSITTNHYHHHYHQSHLRPVYQNCMWHLFSFTLQHAQTLPFLREGLSFLVLIHFPPWKMCSSGPSSMHCGSLRRPSCKFRFPAHSIITVHCQFISYFWQPCPGFSR